MADGPQDILSSDIDSTKYSMENLLAMREKFPDRPNEELARFLIARRNDLQKACEQFQKRQTWETCLPILKADCGDEFLPGKIYQRGVDKDGRPIIVWALRKNLASNRDIEKLSKTVIWWIEYTIRMKMPPQFSKFTVIMDRSGYKRDNSDLELLKKTAATMQTAYPERLHRIIIYPLDLFYYTIWNIAKWFLDPVTRQKVHTERSIGGVERYVEKCHIPSSLGGEDDYDYNPDDFSDFWTMESVKKAEGESCPLRVTTEISDTRTSQPAKSKEGDYDPLGNVLDDADSNVQLAKRYEI